MSSECPVRLYRLCWKERFGDGDIHAGDVIRKELAEQWVREMNLKHPNVLHWIEPEPFIDTTR
jgi:hypothetical protein